MKNPYIYLRDDHGFLKGRKSLNTLAYFEWKNNEIVLGKLVKISYSAIIYIIQHEFFHAILHRLHLYRARDDFDNLPQREIRVKERRK